MKSNLTGELIYISPEIVTNYTDSNGQQKTFKNYQFAVEVVAGEHKNIYAFSIKDKPPFQARVKDHQSQVVTSAGQIVNVEFYLKSNWSKKVRKFFTEAVAKEVSLFQAPPQQGTPDVNHNDDDLPF